MVAVLHMPRQGAIALIVINLARGLVFVLGDAHVSVSSLSGTALIERANQLSPREDADFNRGADDAATICFWTIRALKNEKENAFV